MALLYRMAHPNLLQSQNLIDKRGSTGRRWRVRVTDGLLPLATW